MQSTRRVLVATGSAMALAGLIGCGSAPRPYARGQDIPLGPYSVRVSYVAMKEFQGVRSLAVYLHISGVRNSEDAKGMVARLLGRTVLRDGAGRKTLGVLMPAKHFELAGLSPQDFRSYGDARLLEDSLFSEGDPSAWVALFPVSPQVQGFTLLIGNPDRREGQAGEAAVALGQ